MTQYLSRVLHYLVLVVLTIAALVAMVYVSARTSTKQDEPQQAQQIDPMTASKALVSVRQIKHEQIEIYDTFSGMIRPWEQYALGFEVAGRVSTLGRNQRGEPLDEGDRVSRDQVLARIDSRTLEARKTDAAARLKQSRLDLARIRRLKARNAGAVTDTEMLERETAEALATAQLDIATKNLEDAVLISPIDGIISKRQIKSGESVQPHQAVFEVVQTDRVLLVLGVPESRVPEIEQRVKEIVRNRKLQTEALIEQDDLQFKAYVELIGKNRYGQKWPRREGYVYQISETADRRTGLFEVEVALDNHDGVLKPGMVARAQLVTTRVEGYRVPASSILFRGGKAFVYTVEPEQADVRAMFFSVGKGTVYRARRVELTEWLEQGPDIVVPRTPDGIKTAVVRGQHRLVDGQLVKIVEADDRTPSEIQPEMPVRGPTLGASAN